MPVLSGAFSICCKMSILITVFWTDITCKIIWICRTQRSVYLPASETFSPLLSSLHSEGSLANTSIDEQIALFQNVKCIFLKPPSFLRYFLFRHTGSIHKWQCFLRQLSEFLWIIGSENSLTCELVPILFQVILPE